MTRAIESTVGLVLKIVYDLLLYQACRRAAPVSERAPGG
jgi:hypothetical protein